MLFSLDLAPTDKPTPTQNAVVGLKDILSRRPAGACSVVYLTADAGEGKTTVIQHLARESAEAFKRKETDWLLVPISLGGRPFLRFEDVVVAALVNQLRFQRLYFDAFAELVRMGVIIPALDGFEEIFVETDGGDAVSSLGTLIRQFGGDGSLLIASRKAFFEYKSLQTQARLIDALPGVDVSFKRVKLDRWDKDHFVKYCVLNDLHEAERLYDAVTKRVAFDHPLITRPVLVRRLVDISKQHDEDFSFLADLRPESDGFFLRFIDQIIEREANEKWVDKFSDPPKPLLSVTEHRQLLSYVAEEMWISKTSVLSGEMMDSLTEIFCDTHNKGPIVTRQVRERLKHHALISSLGAGREFSFDHENFRDFFVGQQVGWKIIGGHISDIRGLVRCELMPAWTVDVACSILKAEGYPSLSALPKLQELAKSEAPSSIARENVGALFVRLVESIDDDNVVLEDLILPLNALKGRHLKGVTFKNSYFRVTSLIGTELSNCSFVACEFERLDIDKTFRANATAIDDQSVLRSLGVIRDGDRIDMYDPKRIEQILVNAGLRVPSEAIDPEQRQEDDRVSQDQDSRLAILQKAILSFNRCTFVNQGTFKLRLSINANKFFNEILPHLLDVGVLKVEEKGIGATPRYRLEIPMSRIAEAIAQSRGSYDIFLEGLKKSRELQQNP